MRTINTTFKTFGASLLLLGLKGDSNATEILIDCAESLEEYQGTMAAMSITGPDETVYPGDISLDENGIVHWVVAARDCGIAGNGSARVDLVDDEGTVVASAEARTIIMKTNMQGVAPDQIANWTEAASVALQEARAALLDLIDTDNTATTNEAARQLAETGRVSAETLRASAETARAGAETDRATAESTRASAESDRIAAETARVSEFSTIVANAQAALSYIGPSEASSTASAAHAAGSYFIYNGKLYKATAAIAIGDTITSGTNCAQVPGGSMGEVSNLKSALNNSIGRIENNIGSYNYFNNFGVSLIDVTGGGAYRAGYDCGILPAGNYVLSFERESSSPQIIITTVKNGTYTQSNSITSPHRFSVDGETDVIVRSNAQTVAGWTLHNVLLLSADSIVVKDEIAKQKSALNAAMAGNWFIKNNNSYQEITASGAVVTNNNRKINIDANGALVCSGTVGTDGQRLLRATDLENKLAVGTYNLSFKATLPDTLKSGSKTFYLRLGLLTSPVTVYLKTEPGGNTNVTDQQIGWGRATISILEEEQFCFEAFPYNVKGELSASNPCIIDDLKISIVDEETKQIKESLGNIHNENRVAIVLPDTKYPFRENVYSASIIFPGTQMYVIANGTRITVTYANIVSQIPNNAVVDDRGLVVTLPDTGAFGYDTENNVFRVIANYTYPVSFAPLANRYYDIMWGALIDDANTNGLIVSQHNEKAFVYTTETARHSYVAYGNNGGIKFHVGSFLNLRLINNDRKGYTRTLQWNTISSDISDYITVDGSSADIILPEYSMSLVLNVQDGLLHLRKYSGTSVLFNQYDIILISIAYGFPIKGILYDEYINRLVEDMHKEEDPVKKIELRSQTFTTPYHVGATDFATKCQEFSSLLLGDEMNDVTAPNDFESFLFFTDPHLLEGSSSSWEQRCYEFMSQIQKYYNSTPTTFCLCGGDWLGNSDLPDQACFKMGYINGFMESMFKESYLLVGNHDTNYQGKKDSESATYTTKLSVQSIDDLWYRKGKKAYYKIDGARTTFYCFDTGTENQALAQNDGYQMAQAEWFAESLLSENSAHIALAMHIIYYQYSSENVENGIQPLTLLLSQIAKAYNTRGSIVVNNRTFDYNASTGKVEFMIGGHYHQDIVGNMNGIPWIITTNVRHDETLGASFDLVLADYGNRVIKCIRVGSGENRNINLV